jgi:hypothetical protein
MVPTLGDCFPPGFQEKYKASNIIPGAVFSIFATATTPPKIKRIVILGVNNDQAVIGHLYINSNLNLQCLNTDELRNLQIYLEAEGREYLDRDSFLDCSHLVTMTLEDLKAAYDKDSDIYLGNLLNEELDQAREKASSADTITRKLKKMFDLL